MGHNDDDVKMSKFIVTGGAGFIGSNLVARLLDAGNEVTIIDDFSLGVAENIRKGIAVKTSIKQMSRVEGVFHLGMPSSSPMYKQDRGRIVRVVSDGVDILEYCKKYEIPLVFASTSSLYNGLEPPFREDAKINVTDFYTEARYSLERIAEAYSKIYDLNVFALRLFSVYGINEQHKGEYANLVSQFIWNMRKGNPPLIYGDGTQTRDFIWVDDVVNCFILAMQKTMPQKFNVINVGTGIETSLNELVKKINIVLGTTMHPDYMSNPIKNYVDKTRADTQKMNTVLNPKLPLTSLEAGIKRIVEATP